MGPQAPPPPGVQAAVEGDGFSWRQDAEEIEVSATLPNNATKTEMKVHFQRRALRIEHRGSVILEGQLALPCRPEECTWTLTKGRIIVSMEKADSRPWPSLFSETK